MIGMIEADADVRALCGGRTSGICVPWKNLALNGVLPLVAYQPVTGGLAISQAPSDTGRYQFRLSCFGTSAAETDLLCAAIEQALTWNGFDARGLDACLDGTRPVSLAWPDHAPAADAPAKARSDITVTIIVTI